MSFSRSTVDDAPRSSRGSSDLATEPHLFLVLECDRVEAGGARYSLAGAESVTIGRGAERLSERASRGGERELFIRVPSRSMSSMHARLYRSGATWMIEDLQSRNGTYLNGARVSVEPVRDGDIVELGRTLFIVRTDLAVPVDSPVDLDTAQMGELRPGLASLLPLEAARVATFCRIAPSDVPVLLLGETGTGKELLARALHDLSERKGRFVAVNCGALSPSLVESQLFGHVKGSFSGATGDSVGFIRAADRGTLFLDEIGDLAPLSQAALLRVIEEGEVVPVGSAHPVKVDVRIVAATHKPITETSESDRFRSDLLARISGYRHHLVPLRSRIEDIGLLSAHVMNGLALGTKIHGIAPKAARALLTHAWPMNVRELKQTLKTAALLATNGMIEASALPATLTADAKPASSRAAPAAKARRPLSEEDERLRAELVSQLEACQGNITAVARSMGKASTQIHRWLKRFDLSANRFRRD
jgi:transcriptional regulator with AAA-type ATPase domain